MLAIAKSTHGIDSSDRNVLKLPKTRKLDKFAEMDIE